MARIYSSVLAIHFLLHFVMCHKSSVSVKGSLHCGGYPAGQILIRLWRSDKERNSHTELLGQTYSDGDGIFKLLAQSDMDADWTPVLNIYHDCDDVKNSGRRKLNFLIPKTYVEDGETPKRTFDLGVFNLETYVKEDEERVERVTKKKRSHYLRKRKQVSNARDELPSRNQSAIGQFSEPDDRNDPW